MGQPCARVERNHSGEPPVTGHLSQRVYHPHSQGMEPDTGCDGDDRRQAQPDVGPFLQRTVNGPLQTPKVVVMTVRWAGFMVD